MSKNNAVLTEIPSIYLAPMAGVTDLPFRDLVLSYGVGQVVSEMIASENIKTEICIKKIISWVKKYDTATLISRISER